ncbi:MAG: endonuclease III [Desulfitobacteriaceae bacterium]|nr:endonuclease III [Desulfitobacteriaceae bacterium]
MTKKDDTSIILGILKNTYKDAKTALRFSSPFQLLVATILSAQTTDNQVNKITDILFQIFSEPQDFASLTPEELEPFIQSCGLYKNKAKNIVKAALLIVEKYDGVLPQTREELMKLPGVGRKTANVVLNNAFGIPALAVDTHVFRVAHRLGLSNGKNADETESHLVKIIPPKEWGAAHHWLIWHGRKICTAKNPKCPGCPLNNYCPTFFQERRNK